MWTDQLRFDERGLVPVIAQDFASGEVLMLAYANREALERTLATGEAHYWSRSRAELWRKGGTSGHTQRVEEVRLDCDGDALIFRIRQTGVACHTGEQSCFFRELTDDGVRPAGSAAHILARLERVLAQRDEERPTGSYTTYLFDAGVDKILKKVGEEATETVIAAKNDDRGELRYEAADLVFHLLVLLRERGIPVEEVWQELEGRFGAPPRGARGEEEKESTGGER